MAGTDTQRVTLPISGFSCGGGGALTAERALARMAGVVRAYVNPATETAYVVYDPSKVSPRDLVAAVEAAGLGAGDPRSR